MLKGMQPSNAILPARYVNSPDKKANTEQIYIKMEPLDEVVNEKNLNPVSNEAEQRKEIQNAAYSDEDTLSTSVSEEGTLTSDEIDQELYSHSTVLNDKNLFCQNCVFKIKDETPDSDQENCETSPIKSEKQEVTDIPIKQEPHLTIDNENEMINNSKLNQTDTNAFQPNENEVGSVLSRENLLLSPVNTSNVTEDPLLTQDKSDHPNNFLPSDAVIKKEMDLSLKDTSNSQFTDSPERIIENEGVIQSLNSENPGSDNTTLKCNCLQEPKSDSNKPSHDEMTVNELPANNSMDASKNLSNISGTSPTVKTDNLNSQVLHDSGHNSESSSENMETCIPQINLPADNFSNNQATEIENDIYLYGFEISDTPSSHLDSVYSTPSPYSGKIDLVSQSCTSLTQVEATVSNCDLAVQKSSYFFASKSSSTTESPARNISITSCQVSRIYDEDATFSPSKWNRVSADLETMAGENSLAPDLIRYSKYFLSFDKNDIDKCINCINSTYRRKESTNPFFCLNKVEMINRSDKANIFQTVNEETENTPFTEELPCIYMSSENSHSLCPEYSEISSDSAEVSQEMDQTGTNSMPVVEKSLSNEAFIIEDESSVSSDHLSRSNRSKCSELPSTLEDEDISDKLTNLSETNCNEVVMTGEEKSNIECDNFKILDQNSCFEIPTTKDNEEDDNSIRFNRIMSEVVHEAFKMKTCSENVSCEIKSHVESTIESVPNILPVLNIKQEKSDPMAVNNLLASDIGNTVVQLNPELSSDNRNMLSIPSTEDLQKITNTLACLKKEKNVTVAVTNSLVSDSESTVVPLNSELSSEKRNASVPSTEELQKIIEISALLNILSSSTRVKIEPPEIEEIILEGEIPSPVNTAQSSYGFTSAIPDDDIEMITIKKKKPGLQKNIRRPIKRKSCPCQCKCESKKNKKVANNYVTNNLFHTVNVGCGHNTFNNSTTEVCGIKSEEIDPSQECIDNTIGKTYSSNVFNESIVVKIENINESLTGDSSNSSTGNVRENDDKNSSSKRTVYVRHSNAVVPGANNVNKSKSLTNFDSLEERCNPEHESLSEPPVKKLKSSQENLMAPTNSSFTSNDTNRSCFGKQKLFCETANNTKFKGVTEKSENNSTSSNRVVILTNDNVKKTSDLRQNIGNKSGYEPSVREMNSPINEESSVVPTNNSFISNDTNSSSFGKRKLTQETEIKKRAKGIPEDNEHFKYSSLNKEADKDLRQTPLSFDQKHTLAYATVTLPTAANQTSNNANAICSQVSVSGENYQNPFGNEMSSCGANIQLLRQIDNNCRKLQTNIASSSAQSSSDASSKTLLYESKTKDLSKSSKPGSTHSGNAKPNNAPILFLGRRGRNRASSSNCIGRNLTDITDLPSHILEWNANWLIVQKENKRCVSFICEKYELVKDTYENKSEYFSTYFPLHLLSLWLGISDSWEKCPLSFDTMFENQVEKATFVKISLSASLDTADYYNWPKLEDIVLCKATKSDGTEESLFGRICCVILKDSPSTSNSLKDKASTIKRVRLDLFCAELLHVPILATVKIQILINLRIALLQFDALRNFNSSLKDIIYDPKKYVSRWKLISFSSQNSDHSLVSSVRSILDSMTSRTVTVVDISSPSDGFSAISRITSFLTENKRPIFIVLKSEESFFQLTNMLKHYNPILAIKNKEVRLPEELRQFTLEERSAVSRDIFNGPHVTLTLLPSIYLGDFTSAFADQNLTCVLHDAHLYTEVETTLLLYYGVKNLVLIGNQEAEIDMHPLLKQFHYDVSLFKRFCKVISEYVSG